MNRLKERGGIKKPKAYQYCQKAMDKGFKHGDFNGSFEKYLNKVYLSHKNANNMRIYGNLILIFNGGTLITVYSIPNEFAPIVKAKRTKEKRY